MRDGVRPIDTSTLGPVRIDTNAEAEKVRRAQDVVERHFDPLDPLFGTVLRAVLDFEREERTREA